MNITENYSEWSKADLVKHIFSLKQQNKRLEEDLKSKDLNWNSVLNVANNELQQTKAQLGKFVEITRALKNELEGNFKTDHTWNLISKAEELLTKIK